jgi:tRNA pseudouridine38-40 synthase
VKTWKLTVEYDGSKYSGWQDQINARTVAGVLRKAAEDLFGEGVEIQGAGRTDAGVHALEQVAHLRVRRGSAPPEAILRELNDRLPGDVAVLSVAAAPARFHARHDARRRTYVYQISKRKTAFHKRYVWWIRQRLDVAAMSAAALKIEGRHDFTCFRAADATRPDEPAIVVVDSAAVEESEDMITIRIQASHFLWRMVRRLVGVLVKIGLGELRTGEFEKLLAGHCDPKIDVAAWTAPASGLFLEKVQY